MSGLATDPSNAMPRGGYVGSLLPPGWLPGGAGPVARSLFAGLDAEFEQRRLAIMALRAAHLIDDATGTDLDNLGALLAITRLGGEGDPGYRRRIMATARHGRGASTTASLQALLADAFDIPFSVRDSPTQAANFTVFAIGPLEVPRAVMALVRQKKVAGTIPLGFQLLPRPARVGESRTVMGAAYLGGTVLGGNLALIRLPDLF